MRRNPTVTYFMSALYRADEEVGGYIDIISIVCYFTYGISSPPVATKQEG